MSIITRFAPSSSGCIHLGNARVALFNLLYAKKKGGKFILRIEDSDQNNSCQEFAEQIHMDCLWMHWMQSNQEVIFQSQRIDKYQELYNDLEKNKKIYPCFCTIQELEKRVGSMQFYDRHCLHLSPEEIKEKKESGHAYALRVKIPLNPHIQFMDFLQKKNFISQEQLFHQSTDHGIKYNDFIVRKSDGFPAFIFCNAVDDLWFDRVTHVIRGIDHLTNTYRQILLLDIIFGTTRRQLNYSFLPLMHYVNGPMSKRQKAPSVVDLKNNGYLPMAINNYLFSIGNRGEITRKLPVENIEYMIQLYQPKSLGQSPVQHNQDLMDKYQHILKRKFIEKRAPLMIEKNHYVSTPLLLQTLEEANISNESSMQEWIDILCNPQWKCPCKLILTTSQERSWRRFLHQLYMQDFGNLSLLHKQPRFIYHHLRTLLTGLDQGPPLKYILQSIGKKESIRRLECPNTADQEG